MTTAAPTQNQGTQTKGAQAKGTQTSTGVSPDGELAVIHTPPTIADAQLIVQMAAVDATSGANEGFGVLRTFEAPPTLGQLRKKHPIGSDGYRQVMAFMASCEMTSTFVRQGLLNEALVHDLYWISGGWVSIEKLVRGMRKEAHEPRLYENAEWLAHRGA
ncbi:MAG: hypothetical protein QOJ03_3295 [Frankiaceae bacterium]|jgi:hypothetical protein|nr:hypothetical protein [Frankiaceae bacterium]